MQVNRETVEIHRAMVYLSLRLNEIHAFQNTASRDLELMIIGIATQNNVLETVLGRLPE